MGNYFVYPVPKPSYTYLKDDPTLVFIPRTNEKATHKSFSHSEHQHINTKIPCRYIACQTRISPYLIVFFHGNAEDIGINLSSLLSSLGEKLAMNVICPEYPTYGIYKERDVSMGMEEAMLNDARRVMEYCNKTMRYKYENVILIGRSMGSGVAVRLATEFRVKGVMLISPFTSIREVAKLYVGNLIAKMVPDIFKSIDYVSQIKDPLLFIHGREDKLVPYEMSLSLSAKVTEAKKKVFVSKLMTHNRFKLDRDLFQPIQKFMVKEMGLRAHFLRVSDDDINTNTNQDITIDFKRPRQKASENQKTVDTLANIEVLEEIKPIETTEIIETIQV